LPVGNLRVEYTAAIVGRTDPAPVTEYDLSKMYLRPKPLREADKSMVPCNRIRQLHRFDDVVEKVASWWGTG